MKHTLRNFAMAMLFLVAGSTYVQAGGRLVSLYIGPVTLNNGSGPQTIGVPDSVVYTYTGTRAVYDLATTYELDTVAHTAKIIGLDNYTYTASDSFLTDVTQTVSGGVATNSTRLSRAYDAAGNDTLLLNESWNAAGAAWVGTFRTIYTFNATRQMTGALQQTWSTAAGAWTNRTRFSYQYDAAGRDSVKVQQNWIAATGTWKNVTSNTTLYTPFGKVATLNSRRWNDTISVWKDSTSVVYHYNASNFLLSTVSGPINASSGILIDSVATLTLDAAGLPLTQVFFEKNGGGGFIPQYRYTYSYNAANQRLSNQTEMIDNMYVAHNSLSGFYTYNSAGRVTLEEPVSTISTNGLLDKEQYRFYYEGTTAVPNSSASGAGGITLYPSPATGIVTLSLSDGKGISAGTLTDVRGRTWKRWSMPASANCPWQISVADLPSGVYYVWLSGSGFAGSRMFVVQH